MTQRQVDDYMGYQLSEKASLSDNVANAIQTYIKKYGNPPTIVVEHNPALKFVDVPLPVGLRIVLRAQRVVLPSMLLIGETNENSQMGVDLESQDEMDI